MRQRIPDWDSFELNESTFRKAKRLDDDDHKKYNELKYKFLEKQIALCKKHGVKCMADFGTLLGIVRDGDLIKHDNDTDVQLFAETLNRDFFDDMHSTFECSTDGKPIVEKLFNEEDDYNEMICIWLADKDSKGKRVKIKNTEVFGDFMVSYPYENGKRVLRWPGWEAMTYDNKFAKLSSKQFKGFSVPVPSNPEAYIEYFYGKDWETPKSSFGAYTCDFITAKQAHSYQFSIKENKFKIK